MSGHSDFTAKGDLRYVTGQAIPVLPSVFLALFTASPADSGGGTEVSTSGTGYARIQVAGPATTTAGTTTGSPTVTIGGGVPAWVTANSMTGAGGTVWNKTQNTFVGTISSVGGTTITLVANAANAITSGDVVQISLFSDATSSAPMQAVNGAAINFAQATGSGFGTCVAFGLFDASSSGNLLAWDYLGNFSWLPATVSAASPGVITAKAHGYSNGDTFVFSTEYGGTAPTFSAGNYTGLMTVAGVTTDTLNVTGVNTSATGNGSVRKVLQQPISVNVTASFAASSLVLTDA